MTAKPAYALPRDALGKEMANSGEVAGTRLS
jgi:hypothetical protein